MPKVRFPRKEQDVLRLLRDRVSIKDIGGLLEISVRTVRDRLAKSCRRAHLVDETEMYLFLIQNPGILMQGAVCDPGLHILIMWDGYQRTEFVKPCRCGNTECLGHVATIIKSCKQAA